MCTANKAIAALKYSCNSQPSEDSRSKKSSQSGTGKLISIDIANVYRVFACNQGQIENTHAIIIDD